jgi:ribosome recycling factor
LPVLKKRKPERAEEKPSSSKSHHANTKQVTGGKQKNIDPAASTNSPLDPNAPDPLDFSALDNAIGPIDTHFKSQLQGLVHGGRFNPETIGALSVHVKPAHDAPADTPTDFPLRELAQVVPRGRTHISLLLNDVEYTKPIMSAVQSSPDFNQQPQKSEDNELELILRVEADRKDETVKRAKEVTQQWRDRVRQARSKHEKAMKEWKKKKLVLPDDFKLAERELQKVQDKKMKEIDTEEAQVVRQIQR